MADPSVPRVRRPPHPMRRGAGVRSVSCPAQSSASASVAQRGRRTAWNCFAPLPTSPRSNALANNDSTTHRATLLGRRGARSSCENSSREFARCEVLILHHAPRITHHAAGKSEPRHLGCHETGSTEQEVGVTATPRRSAGRHRCDSRPRPSQNRREEAVGLAGSNAMRLFEPELWKTSDAGWRTHCATDANSSSSRG